VIDYLRETAGLKGTKQGCDGGECGACTVLVEGRPRLACSTLAHQVAGKRVETIEGLASQGQLSRLQAAFHEKLGTQCGFCAGMVMASKRCCGAAPSSREITAALAGNLPLHRM
jgi:4-hydroxybenzoyl-CoA reductase subunit gamma